MDRSYKRAETVNVYADQSAKDTGAKTTTISRVPYSMHGYDSYAYKGAIYPGYRDPMDSTADACIILTDR